jgi:hypothetical protein
MLEMYKDTSVCYKKYKSARFNLSLKKGDKICITNNGSIISVQNILRVQNKEFLLLAQKVPIVKPLFTQPLDSSILEMYYIDLTRKGALKPYLITDIREKCIIGKNKYGFFSSPKITKVK